MTKKDSVLLGFEVGTGERVEIPIRHMVVTGITQEAGKTTATEAIVSRSGVKALAFLTKRGEGGFSSANRIEPYFREQADWQFTASILEASRGEKLKFERAWIIRASKGATTLRGVHQNVKKLMEKSKGMSADVYLTLDAYLEAVVPQIDKVKWATKIELKPGINIMDLTSINTEMQHLVIKSSLDWVLNHEENTVVVIPEAWRFIPEGRGTPVKLSAEAYIRQAAALGNYLFLDSQDIAGISKLILKSVPLWILGVQREANEIKRTLSEIPAGIKKPKPENIAHLGLGQFYACWGKNIHQVYVQPSWMESEIAQKISMGQAEFDDYLKPIPDPEFKPVGIDATGRDWSEELTKFYSGTDNANGDTVNHEFLREVIERQTTILEKLSDQVLVVAKRQTVSVSSGNGVSIGNGMPDKDYNIIPKTNIPVNMEDALYETFRSRILKDSAVLMKLSHMAPEIEIDIERPVINLGGNDLRSWLAILLSEGFFDKGANGNVAFKELKRRGKAVAVPNVYTMLDRFAAEGFVTIERSGKNKTYLKNPDLKITRRDK